MKSTGIVRRLDDLGRVVIPKEIRRTLRVKEGDPLEIFVDKDTICFRKYSPIKELGNFAQEYADSIYSAIKLPVLIADTDVVVAVAAGVPKREYLDKVLPLGIQYHIDKGLKVVNGCKAIDVASMVYAPVTVHGDVTGYVIIFDVNKDGRPAETMGVMHTKLVETAATFIARYMEGGVS